MKKTSLVLLLFFMATTFSTFAQDIIVKKDGTTILSKVIEIGSKEVKYKKFSNVDGPTYTIAISELQTINYENGEMETFSTTKTTSAQNDTFYDMDSKQVEEGFTNVNMLQKQTLLADAKNLRTIGKVCYWVGFIGGFGFALLASSPDDTFWTFALRMGIPWGIGIAGMGVCESFANNKERAAESVASIPVIKQDIGLGHTNLTASVDILNDHYSKEHTLGIGLSINF